MKVMVTGHRIQKLGAYDHEWIQLALSEALRSYQKRGYVIGYSGMASGVDLWFCKACIENGICYIACPPFEEQADTMSKSDAALRRLYMYSAAEIKKIRNSQMIEITDAAIVVFDGNKGGTANCFQQLIEKKKDFIWINPVKQVIWECV